jgi:threonine/homoserine/homoserine lactone efflux protein
MITPQLLTYIGIVFLLTISPGADTMLVIRNVLGRGPLAGILTTLGISSGLFIHATLSALGLSLILVRSSTAFEFVKLIGAGYLIYLGIRSLTSARQMIRDEPLEQTALSSAVTPGGWRSAGEGLLTNVLNPKVAVFYLAFLPQFINPGEAILAKSLLLAGIHGLLGIIWLSLVSFSIGRLSAFLKKPKVRSGLEAVSGAVLIGFGIKLALERR